MGVIVKLSAGLLVPPPGWGVKIVIIEAPGFSTSSAGTMPVISVSLWKIVVSGIAPVPGFHCTMDCGVKFFPVTFRLNWGWPACTLAGLSPVAVGEGLLMYSLQEGSAIIRNMSIQKANRDFPCKSFTSESVGRSPACLRNR